jgi:hypothetical protein
MPSQSSVDSLEPTPPAAASLSPIPASTSLSSTFASVSLSSNPAALAPPSREGSNGRKGRIPGSKSYSDKEKQLLLRIMQKKSAHFVTAVATTEEWDALAKEYDTELRRLMTDPPVRDGASLKRLWRRLYQAKGRSGNPEMPNEESEARRIQHNMEGHERIGSSSRSGYGDAVQPVFSDDDDNNDDEPQPLDMSADSKDEAAQADMYDADFSAAQQRVNDSQDLQSPSQASLSSTSSSSSSSAAGALSTPSRPDRAGSAAAAASTRPAVNPPTPVQQTVNKRRRMLDTSEQLVLASQALLQQQAAAIEAATRRQQQEDDRSRELQEQLLQIRVDAERKASKQQEELLQFRREAEEAANRRQEKENERSKQMQDELHEARKDAAVAQKEAAESSRQVLAVLAATLQLQQQRQQP